MILMRIRVLCRFYEGHFDLEDFWYETKVGSVEYLAKSAMHKRT